MIRRAFGEDFVSRTNLRKKRTNWLSGLGFAKALEKLLRNPDLSRKYFDDTTLGYEFEAHDHFTSSHKKTILKNAHYSTPFKQDLVKNAIKLKQGAAIVIPVVDRNCPDNDAARYISGLKRGMITIPTNIVALETWIMDGDKKYQEHIRLFGKTASWDHFRKWRLRRSPLNFCNLAKSQIMSINK